MRKELLIQLGGERQDSIIKNKNKKKNNDKKKQHTPEDIFQHSWKILESVSCCHPTYRQRNSST